MVKRAWFASGQQQEERGLATGKKPLPRVPSTDKTPPCDRPPPRQGQACGLGRRLRAQEIAGDVQYLCKSLACAQRRDPALIGGARDHGHRGGDAGGRVVHATGAGHPALRALPRATLRLLPGGAARRGDRAAAATDAPRGALVAGLAVIALVTLGNAGLGPIIPASNGGSGRDRPPAPAPSEISAAPAACWSVSTPSRWSAATKCSGSF